MFMLSRMFSGIKRHLTWTNEAGQSPDFLYPPAALYPSAVVVQEPVAIASNLPNHKSLRDIAPRLSFAIAVFSGAILFIALYLGGVIYNPFVPIESTGIQYEEPTITPAAWEEEKQNVPEDVLIPPNTGLLIQAENYDLGGEGVAYSDYDEKNQGGEYRNDGVDIVESDDGGGGYHVSWIYSNEWISYSFSTEETTNYKLLIRASRNLWEGDLPAEFHIEIDGIKVTDTINMPDTGDWRNWVTIESKNFPLDAGEHKLVFRVHENDGRVNLMNLNWIQLEPVIKVVDDAEDREPATVIIDEEEVVVAEDDDQQLEPLYIQAEDYHDYYDADDVNYGYSYRDDGVDIEPTTDIGGGYNVGWIDSQEWMSYVFIIDESDNYAISARVAREHSDRDDPKFRILVDGVNVSGRVSVGVTGSWQTWETLYLATVELEPGEHTLKFAVNRNQDQEGLFNLNWFKLMPGASVIEPEPDPEPEPVLPPVVDPPEEEPDPPPPPPAPDPPSSDTVGPREVSCTGVTVRPGDDLDYLSSTNSIGTTFCLKAGVYRQQSVNPKNNQKFIGELGAVLDGEFAHDDAFGGYATGVVIDNLEIKNYDSNYQFGAINNLSPGDWYYNPIYGPGGWEVRHCNVYNNSGGGVVLSRDNAKIINSYIHHNVQIGVKLLFGSNQSMTGSEVAYNNQDQEVDWGWEAGGSKFWETDSMVLDGNYVHDNWGPGLWSDHGNANTTYSNNVVEDNAGPGIFHEISYGAEIFDNTITGNGNHDYGWLWGAGIQIANAGPAEIYGNYLENNGNGIAFSDQGRGYGPLSGNVYSNTLVDSGRTGVVSDVEDDLEGPFNFYGNTYIGDFGFALNDSYRDYDYWLQYYPND